MGILSRIKVNADSIGDALVAVLLFVFLAVVLWVAFGIGLPTGGDELIGRVR